MQLTTLLENTTDQAIALAVHLGMDYDMDPDYNFSEDEYLEIQDELETAQKLIDDGDYLVLTDSEADKVEDNYLDNYIDDVIYQAIPSEYHTYFDDNAWKRDVRMDARGHTIASYDGDEHEQEVNGTTYFIYRIN